MQQLTDFLQAIIKAIAERNIHALRAISGKCTSRLAIEQKAMWFDVCLLSYCAAKIIEKPRLAAVASAQLAKINNYLLAAIEALKKGEVVAAQKQIVAATRAVRAIEVVDARFVHDILTKGRTKIASILYAQGLSLNTALALTGAARAEVLRYCGRTRIADRFGRTLSAAQRLKYAREILK